MAEQYAQCFYSRACLVTKKPLSRNSVQQQLGDLTRALSNLPHTNAEVAAIISSQLTWQQSPFGRLSVYVEATETSIKDMYVIALLLCCVAQSDSTLAFRLLWPGASLGYLQRWLTEAFNDYMLPTYALRREHEGWFGVQRTLAVPS